MRESVEVRFQGGSSRFADAPSSRADGALPMPTAQALPFASGWFDSSLAFGLREGERVEASAIVVYQRFAAWDLGWLPPQGAIFGTEVEPRFDRGLEERVYGYGVRLGYRLELDRGVELAVETQSRVDMEPFKSFRGVYSDNGDFDVPAVVGVSLRTRLTPGIELAGKLQRVYFSGVRPFTSAALPLRFLALLGDASAPRFAWEDLDLLSAELSYSPSERERVALAVSGRQSPLPSAPILREALADEAPSYHLSVGYERDFGAWGRLNVRMAYAPRQGFLALGPFQPRSDSSGPQREFDLAWVVGF